MLPAPWSASEMFTIAAKYEIALTSCTSLGLTPIVLRPKEGLAIMNGTAVMTAIACLAYRPLTVFSETGHANYRISQFSAERK